MFVDHVRRISIQRVTYFAIAIVCAIDIEFLIEFNSRVEIAWSVFREIVCSFILHDDRDIVDHSDTRASVDDVCEVVVLFRHYFLMNADIVRCNDVDRARNRTKFFHDLKQLVNCVLFDANVLISESNSRKIYALSDVSRQLSEDGHFF